MRFSPEHKVKIDSMTPTEAKIFIVFLETEIIRHIDDINQAKALIGYVQKEILDEPR